MGRRLIQPEVDVDDVHLAAAALAGLTEPIPGGAGRVPADLGRRAVLRRRRPDYRAIGAYSGGLYHRHTGTAGRLLRISRSARRPGGALAAGRATGRRRLELPLGQGRVPARVLSYVHHRSRRFRSFTRGPAARSTCRNRWWRPGSSSSTTGCTDPIAPARWSIPQCFGFRSRRSGISTCCGASSTSARRMLPPILGWPMPSTSSAVPAVLMGPGRCTAATPDEPGSRWSSRDLAGGRRCGRCGCSTGGTGRSDAT